MKIQVLKTQEHATEICLAESESSTVYRKLSCDKMGRAPVYYRERPHRGAWSMPEDSVLIDYINAHGAGRWSSLAKRAGLECSGKSCRLRWMNHLRPDIKSGNISPEEEELIIRMHRLPGNRWSLIAGRLPGRTDHKIKNYWNAHIRIKLVDGIMNDESVRKVSNKTTFEINYRQTTVRRHQDLVTKDCFNHPIKELLSVDSVGLDTSNLLLDFDTPLPPPEFLTDFSVDDCEINGTMAIVDLD